MNHSDKTAENPEIPDESPANSGPQDPLIANEDDPAEPEATYKPLTIEDIRAATHHKREPVTEYILPLG